MLKTQNLDSYDNVCFVSYTAVFVLSLKLSTVENWYGGRNIFFFLEKRQRGRFAGFSLNVSNTDLSKTEVDENSTLCYKDGPLLPFLDFKTTTCAMIGRYVTFYNERFDKQTFPAEYEVYNVFTELCEVFIFGKSIFFKYTAIIETENATVKYCILEINSNSNLYF